MRDQPHVGLDATTLVTEMLNPSRPPLSFDAVLGRSREAYLASPIGKARKAIAKADRLTDTLAERLGDLSCALSVGNGTEAARNALQAAILDLRIAVGDAEVLARLAEAA